MGIKGCWHEQINNFMKTMNLEQLNAAHGAAQEAADYDRWFSAKAQAALDGLTDDSNTPYTPGEWATKRAEIFDRLKGRKTA